YLARDVLVRVFYALGDGNTPFRLSLAGIGLNAIADWVLVGGPSPWGLQLPASNFGAPGLVLATVVVNVATCGALLWVLHRRLGGLPLGAWGRDTALLTLTAVACGGLAWAAAQLVQWPQGLLGLILRPGISALLGLALFGVLATWAGVPEAQQLLGGLRRRLPGRKD
ncbi:MAG: lipid II flippase MurJ, partial [Cyanobacteria bacterium M_surface_9_m1_291]|nr:lipid II flippase MurJ [Cyanobacteria bacterium M_surface_9_m1_291]